MVVGGEILAEGEFLDKPPSVDYFNKAPSSSPYQFESVAQGHKDKRVEITVNAQGGIATATTASANKGQVEHVHHHYHHNADGIGQTPTVVVNPVPVAAAAVTSSLSSSNSFGSSLSTNGFVPVGSGSLPLGGSISGVNTASYGGQSIANYGTSGTGLTFGASKPVLENFGKTFQPNH